MGKKNEYASIEQYKSIPGLISILMGFGVVVGYVLLFLMAYMAEGEAGLWIGVLGFFLLFVIIGAILMAIKGLRDPDAQNTRPVIGLIENSVLFIGILVLYIVGATKG
ncbi:MAG: hypothetical protein HFJ09_05245 [Lachnospiraceae bacterium]|nr:hypothetical protein [Lachnospiraceae bacterium]